MNAFVSSGGLCFKASSKLYANVYDLIPQSSVRMPNKLNYE